MGLENAQAVYELDIERVFPTHIPHVFNLRILGRSKWNFGVLGRLKPALLTKFADKFDNSLVHFRHVHWFHRIQIHTRNDFTIVLEYMHMSRWVIANPPDKNVTATTNPAHSSTFFRGRELIVDVKEVRDGAVANTRGACAPGISAVEPYFGAEAATSFWKRGSLRSESNIRSSRSNAGVRGGFAASGPSYGIESSFSKVEMARSRSCGMRAATRARMSSGLGPVSASFATGLIAIARSARVSAAVLSPRAIFVSARSPIRTKFSGCSFRNGSSSVRA